MTKEIKQLQHIHSNNLTVDNELSAKTGKFLDKVSSANGFFQTSDVRNKKNIENVSFTKAIDANTVPIKQFNYIDDANERLVYGIIAQEAENYGLEEIVYTDEDGKKSVDYTSLIMLKLAYLENENKLLRNSILEINKKLDKLK